jgi:hypothetical protein
MSEVFRFEDGGRFLRFHTSPRKFVHQQIQSKWSLPHYLNTYIQFASFMTLHRDFGLILAMLLLPSIRDASFVTSFRVQFSQCKARQSLDITMEIK